MKTLIALVLMTSAAQAQDCALSFTMDAANRIGTIAPGTELTGTATFSVTGDWEERDTTVSYYTQGELEVAGPDGGSLTADLATVHVIRTPWTADYVSFDAINTQGDLGGETRYVDPALLTLFGTPGSLASSAIPSGAEWDALSVRRTFQVHTPTTMEVFIGPVTSFTGRCE